MNYNSVIIKLYFILIYADGKVDQTEVASGERMRVLEDLSEDDFKAQLEYLKSQDSSILLAQCIAELKKLERKQQIRIIAWLCIVANADGIMDLSEWRMIYKIYYKELELPLHEIFKMQQELSRLNIYMNPIFEEIKAIA